MSKFHNPYVYIPVVGEPGPGCIPKPRKGWPPHLTHDRYVDSTTVDDQAMACHSGRLVCRLTLEDLVAVGAQQVEGKDPRKHNNQGAPRKVTLFQRNGTYGIAGSSLRGMISSVFELASNSTLRVLGDPDLSVSRGQNQGRTPEAHLQKFFRAVNKDLVPLQERDGRTRLTLAEQVFGVVEKAEQDRREANRKDPVLALAGRVDVSDAIAVDSVKTLGTAKVSKILDSPKFRYRSFHFTEASNPDGSFLPNVATNLQPGTHIPNGRKVYLRHRDGVRENWTSAQSDPGSRSIHQKAEVNPLDSGTFWFHIDFHNLSDLDLQCLLYALCPHETFTHLIGMGKPLGLGKVKLEVMGTFLVDRRQRYSVRGVSQPRYHRVWKSVTPPDSWPTCYQREADAETTGDGLDALKARDAYRTFVEENHVQLGLNLYALELVGDPSKVQHPVHYPQIEDNADKEARLYEWFVANEEAAEPQHTRHQYLPPLTYESTDQFTTLPTLDRNTGRPPRGGGGHGNRGGQPRQCQQNQPHTHRHRPGQPGAGREGHSLLEQIVVGKVKRIVKNGYRLDVNGTDVYLGKKNMTTMLDLQVGATVKVKIVSSPVEDIQATMKGVPQP